MGLIRSRQGTARMRPVTPPITGVRSCLQSGVLTMLSRHSSSAMDTTSRDRRSCRRTESLAIWYNR